MQNSDPASRLSLKLRPGLAFYGARTNGAGLRPGFVRYLETPAMLDCGLARFRVVPAWARLLWKFLHLFCVAKNHLS